MTRNRILITCAIASLALGLSACSSDDKASAVVGGPLAEVPELPPLEAAKRDAAAEATAAGEAADVAGGKVVDADGARMNVATMQTNGTSGGHAYEARKYAKMADDEYMKAMAASTAAAAAADADDLGAATRALVKAEDARKAADIARDKAVLHADLAIRDAANELKIDGTVKSVGDLSIDADAGGTTKTTDDGQTAITGLLAEGMQPMHLFAAVPGQPFVVGTAPTLDTPYKQAVAERSLTIGKTLDSPDDMARLMLVTSYVVEKDVKVYTRDPTATVSLTGTKVGFVSSNTTEEATTNDLELTNLGEYIFATNVGVANTLEETDEVAKDAESKTVYSYDTTPMNNMDPLIYVVRISTLDNDDGKTYTYVPVDIFVDGADGDDMGEDLDDVYAWATLPEATAYKHIHFGVWAALEKAAANGDQKIADLGIGFVQNFSGEGLTSIGGGIDDVPNTGIARYNGDWVAAVRAKNTNGDGDISLRSGAAAVAADFGTGKVTADLTDLATLEGDIAGNTFSGTKASAIDAMHGLDAAGTFTGEFAGGFYGAQAAETAGVFDFTSKGAKAGEFRGAFGGDN